MFSSKEIKAHLAEYIRQVAGRKIHTHIQVVEGKAPKAPKSDVVRLNSGGLRRVRQQSA